MLRLRRIALVVAMFWIGLGFQACKENAILPANLLPQIDNVNTFGSDTFQVISHTIYQDSIQTGGYYKTTRVSNQAGFYHALGTIAADPVFGKTTASFHVEVLPPFVNYQFKTNYPSTQRTIDSIVLSVPYKGAYGDTSGSSTQTYHVYRSLKSFSRDSAQFETTSDSADYTRLLASQSVNYTTLSVDSPTINGVKLAPQVRFRLANWFIDSLQTQVDSGANGAAADFSKFLAWWKGFYITPADTNSGKAIGFFDTYNTRMYIYYRYTTVNNVKDTTADVFSFDPNNCNRFNRLTRSYQGTPALPYLNTQQAGGDSILFVQANPGMGSFLRFPHLHQFDNVIVNKAELTFTAISPFQNWADTMAYPLTARLQAIRSDSNQFDAVLEDYSVFGSTYVDGRRILTTINGTPYIQYKFKLTHSIQQIISLKNSNFRLKITGLNDGYTGRGRVVLGGSGSKVPQLKPSLYIIYTKINK